MVAYSGRYHRAKNVLEYSNWLGMSSMSLRKPIVVCLYVWTLKAFSRCTSKSFWIGFALFLLYSPRTARASVLNADSGYERL